MILPVPDSARSYTWQRLGYSADVAELRDHGDPGDAPSVPPPLTPPVDMTRPSAAEEARTIAAATNTGTLATLTADGDQTVLVAEERGMPADMVAGYGAGIQVHVEDLGSYLAGGGRCDSDARMAELYPVYREEPVTPA